MTVIFNPKARNGGAGRAYARLRRLFDVEGLDVRILQTEGVGHAIELARSAAEDSEVVVAVGGDGTIHEVANGLIESRRSTALGILPLGTGNDFVKMIGIPRNLESAIKILTVGKRKAVDYGTLLYLAESEENHRYFVNTAGIGFDAEVGFRVSSFKKLPGFTAYLAALFNTLQQFNTSEARVDIHGPNGSALLYQGDMLLGTFGNGQYSGGLFRLTPKASIDDGWLDVGIIERMAAWQIIRNIPRVLRGAHTNMSEFHGRRAQGVEIHVNPGQTLHADGEILNQQARTVKAHIVPGGLSVIVP